MKPSRITTWTCLPAAAIGIATLCGPNNATAADAPPASFSKDSVPAPGSRSVIIEHRALPEVAPGGTIVLRGSRSFGSTIAQPGTGGNGQGYGSSNAPAGTLPPGAGGDRSLDASGLDRTGIEPRTDNSGLETRGP